MFEWFNGLTALGKGLLLLVFIGVVLGAVKMWTLSIEDNAKQVGSKTVVVETQKKVIEDVQAANEARVDNAARTGEQRNADCLRRSRTPQFC